jgi:pyruvate/2-oxoglutarate dehydrogenase complex dihydrolipoamide dehydrogenase (E3) component
MGHSAARIVVSPDDESNRALVAAVHPPDWLNPEPAGRYNLAVLGAGPAGLVTSAIAAGLGAKVALVEQHLMGGDCLNVGCIPSKALLRAARVWSEVRRGEAFGVACADGARFDFATAMARVRRLRAGIAPHDGAARFRSLGIDVHLGAGRFTGPDTLEVGGRTLRFARAAVCTGGRPAIPPVPGLVEAGFLTSETVFTLTEQPPRLAVIGGGPVGCELAQCFARFGSRVTLIHRRDRVLPRDVPDAAAVVQARMAADGVVLLLGARVKHVVRQADEKILVIDVGDGSATVAVDAILVASGRIPNVDGIGLEAAGVAFDAQRGVATDDHLRTANPRIYAAGDVSSPFRFTHMADALAKIVVQNALFPHPLGLGQARAGGLVVPWCTYTEPELAHVGLSEADAQARGIATESLTVPLTEVDRAVLDGQDEGFARVVLRKGTDRIVGATVVAAHAGDLISLFTLMMTARKGLAGAAATIFPYPTQAEVVRRLAGAWQRGRLTPARRALLTKFFGWRR